MTKGLKIDVAVAEIGEDGIEVSKYVTKESHDQDMAKKADLLDGKVKTEQLPGFKELSGVSDALDGLETKLRGETDQALDQAKDYTDGIIQNALSTKADLIDGRVPSSQATMFKDVPGAKGTIDGLRQSFQLGLQEVQEDLRDNYPRLVNEKIPDKYIPFGVTDINIRIEQFIEQVQSTVNDKLSEQIKALETITSKAQRTDKIILDIITSDGEKRVELEDGTTTPNLNMRISERLSGITKTDITDLQNKVNSIDELLEFVRQENELSTFDVIQTVVPRFSADCWTVDGVRSMTFCIVGDSEDGFEVRYTSRRKDDFAAAIFFSEDKYMHPYLSYETKPDFTNCVLKFSMDISGDAPTITDEVLGTVMTVVVNEGNKQKSYYLRLANLADEKTLTDTHADITIDWNTVKGGFDEDEPFDKTNIDRIFIGCLTTGFEKGNTDPLEKQQSASIVVTNITTSGSNGTYVRKSLKIPQHTLGMCTGYDDSYNVNPRRIIKNCYDLGYRGHINHYCGMSHFYDQKWNEEQKRFVVTKHSDAPEFNLINKETALWHKSFADNAFEFYMKAIFSISFEMYSEAAELSWTQRDWDDNYAFTGYIPPSYLLSPCNEEAMSWLQGVFVEFADILHESGHIPYMQVGEPWWWINADGKPCVYDYPTKLKFNAETGLYAPEIPNRMSEMSGDVFDAFTKFLQKELGNAVLNVRKAVKEKYPDSQISTLFFLPSILGEDSGIASIINYPIEQYKYPNLDFIQTETYDWLVVGEFDKALRGFTSAIDELGYPPHLVHYLLGFVPDDFLGKIINPDYQLDVDGVKVWQSIMGNAYLGKEYNVAKQYIWAYNQVMRDGLVVMPQDFLKKFWIKEKQYTSQVKEGVISGTPIANMPTSPIRPNEPETPWM